MKTRSEVPFFTKEELILFNKVANKRYDRTKEAHVKNRKKIFNTIFAKTNFWAESIIPKGFELKKDHWTLLNDYRHMVYKPYSWARIYRKKYREKYIFFTVGVVASRKSLLYKIDCQWNDAKNSLNDEQVVKFNYKIAGTEAKRQEVKFSQISSYNWDKLFKETSEFIENNLQFYDEIVDYVWQDQIDTRSQRNILVLRDPPTKKKKKPRRKNLPKGDIDYGRLHSENMKLGDFGEQMVREFEKKMLAESNLKHLAKLVKKVKDGEGYDILSFDLSGKEKHIEVKTTKGNNNTNFPISANEYNYFEKNKKNSVIYRVYNANPKQRFAEFFITDWKTMQELFIRNDLTYIMKRKHEL